MSWARNGAKRAAQDMARLPHALRRNLDKAAGRLGPYGVRIAQALVAVDTGRTKGNIKYETVVDRDGRGWRYRLIVYVDAPGKREALPVFVTEFGRGHGRAAARARGSLPPRPYLRPSRELVAKRARGSFSRAMRAAARETIGA